MSFPLRNKNIVLTRSEEQSEETITELQKFGANVISYPTLKINFEKHQSVLVEAVKKLVQYDYLIFTSANAVKAFYDAIISEPMKQKKDLLKVVAIGNKTRKVCEEYGFEVDIVPDDFSAEGIIKSLQKIVKAGEKIFLPISELATDKIKDEFSKLGVFVNRINVYSVELPSQNSLETARKLLKKIKPDLIIFTSPSTFYNFIKLEKIENLQNYFNEILIAAIGVKTKSIIEHTDLKVEICPNQYTMQSLIQSIADYFELLHKTENIGRGV